MTDTSEVTQVITAPRRERQDPVAVAAIGPGRLRLRRRLLLWSLPVLVLLLVLAVKLASVGILGNRLAPQFAAHDQAGMESTLGWIDVGSLGRGHHERFAAGDMAALGGDLHQAYEQFAAAHEMAPSACPPRANFALTSENLSDNELRQGHFNEAEALLAPAAQAANDDKDCFATSTSAESDVRSVVEQTPDRLAAKLTALKAGAITATADGYDYLRAPGGSIQTAGNDKPCPFEGDDERVLRDCIKKSDAERRQKVTEAQQREQQRQSTQQQVPGQPPPPPEPRQSEQPPPSGTPAAAPSDDTVEFPSAPNAPRSSGPPPPEDRDPVKNCPPALGKPLDALAAALCTTSGPLP